MTPEQRATLMAVADQMDAAAKSLDAVFRALPTREQMDIEGIPGMDHFDCLLASQLREYLAREVVG